MHLCQNPLHQDRSEVSFDGKKEGLPLISMTSVGSPDALYESVLPEYMLRNTVRGFGDGSAIAFANAVIETQGDQVLCHSPSTKSLGDPQEKQV